MSVTNDTSINHYYPPWLTDQACGDEYKAKLVSIYDSYYKETDKKLKQEKLNELKVYLTIVCDIIAYRYLVKHHSNLFRRLHITVEEYMEYKVERMYVTIKDKKGRIDDILAYIYMSFMLSSPRLIYDYAEKIGRCKLVRDVLPYFQVQRLKFFFIERGNTTEHIIFDFSTVDMDSTEKSVRSDIERYSLSKYMHDESASSSESDFDVLRTYIEKFDFKYKKSKEYLIYVFDHWKDSVESDFESVKQEIGINSDYSLFDYIRYKYENHQIDLSYEEYLDVLNVLNTILKGRKKNYNDKN